jgi:hypothetical protein
MQLLSVLFAQVVEIVPIVVSPDLIVMLP